MTKLAKDTVNFLTRRSEDFGNAAITAIAQKEPFDLIYQYARAAARLGAVALEGSAENYESLCVYNIFSAQLFMES